MKSVAVVVGLFAMLAVHVTAEPDFKNMVATCKSKTGVSDDVIKNMRPNQVPQTHDEECYLGCMNHELGTVFPNNKINVEQIKVMMAPIKENNPDFYQKWIKVTETCASKITENSDDCAAAKIISQCLVDESAKIGLKMPGS